jgi:hypothetical protein
MRKPWVACIEPKLGCEDTLAGLFNVFHIKVDGKERTVKAPMKRLWDMIDADIEFKRSGTLNNHGTVCFRLEFLGMLMSRTAFSDVSESRMSHPTFSDVSGSRMSNAIDSLVLRCYAALLSDAALQIEHQKVGWVILLSAIFLMLRCK